jgi:GT2 family glycosyltransferase
MTVSIVITCYNEDIEAINQTLDACLNQTHQVQSIVMVDDCSRDLIILEQKYLDKVHLIRNEVNQGISASRNRGIKNCDTDYIVCLNIEVLLAKDWVFNLVNYASKLPQCAVVYTKILPLHSTLLSSYRMRFQERQFATETGKSDWAPGNAVLFRTTVLNTVNGYNEDLKLIQEDSEICERIAALGLEIHFYTDSVCYSIQKDSVELLAKKQLVRNGLHYHNKVTTTILLKSLTNTLLNRLSRNGLKFRWHFLPLDILTYFKSIQMGMKWTK